MANRFLEEENRQEISSLKAVLAQLNTSVAINTEATKGLKEVVEKEFNRHIEDRQGIENRVLVVETRVDKIDVDMARQATVETRLLKVEDLAETLKIDAATHNGWSVGVKWVLGIALTISVPCAGYVVISLLSKVFGFGPH
jgi:hypothetical protein